MHEATALVDSKAWRKIGLLPAEASAAIAEAGHARSRAVAADVLALWGPDEIHVGFRVRSRVVICRLLEI